MSDVQSAVPSPPVIGAKPRQVAGSTVVVGSKLPNGLVLRVFNMEEFSEPVLGGGSRSSKRARQDVAAGEYVLNGTAIDLGEVGRGNLPRHRIAGGFALTAGIPKDFWERWLEQNRRSDLVRNNLVFCHATEEGAFSMGLEREKLKSGLEPLDPDNPPADVRRIRRGTRDNNVGNDADNL